MVILMTSSSSSKTEFTCIFYDVFDVGDSAGSSLLEVYLLFLLGIPPLPLRTITNKLEFAQFGAHLQKLWQFWFYCYPLLSSPQNEGLLVLLIWGMR